MESLGAREITAMFLALGSLLAAALILGELAKRFNQPAILGEILAGILLGPTVLGMQAPSWSDFIFPAAGTNALVLDGIVTLAIVLFLLVAGVEVDISSIWRQGKTAIAVGLAGVIAPFSLGFTVAWLAPRAMGLEPGADPAIFALFIATALSISALPVIAKILMDLNLYRSDLGMVIIAAAVFNDLFGWIVFAVILGLLGTHAGDATVSIGSTIVLVFGFALLMLTVVRWLLHRVLPWIYAHASWPGGVLGFTLVLALFGAALTESMGVHAIFGSFLVGVAIGDTPHFREQTRAVIEQFVSFIFAPLFFASIGLKVNFLANFDPLLVVVVLVIATAGKVLGCGLGGRMVGMPARESWALGFGMNARGAMEIILALLALRFGLIGERLFVALVIMAVVTSLMSGPVMQHLLRLKKPTKFKDFLKPKVFLPALQAATPSQAIRELSGPLAKAVGLDPQQVERAVLEREGLMATGLGRGMAVPHARLADLNAPAIGLGISTRGISFGGPDGRPAHLIFLILTPVEDNGAQIEILADIARTFHDDLLREKATSMTKWTEFLALVRSGTAG